MIEQLIAGDNGLRKIDWETRIHDVFDNATSDDC